MSDLRKAAQQALEFVTSEAWGTTPYMDMRVYEDAARLRDVLQTALRAVDFVSLLREADEIVRGKPTWKRFIDGTPLSNDIAVWMTVFAQDVARRADPPQRKPLTEEEIESIWRQKPRWHAPPIGTTDIEFARAVERAHGIKEDGNG